ncbi:hypothetical protein BEWA_036700 [Theileria equi strain WA]|uniref:Uncharacterized protein n=1 Tax=Theileria equi strain WA TaxID=1537102 RepID=L1LEC0_THEEQ|nr:hypothetical protein BEWA_036700 [Theileria equi strain WA]EKX73634.1 hypothetical protein BEWA_036700 [Theileria equi strain WA]|eukprot:XP_004833086.1 hypothetical protein BEWA_036700 [Theileria equi strain WA]
MNGPVDGADCRLRSEEYGAACPVDDASNYEVYDELPMDTWTTSGAYESTINAPSKFWSPVARGDDGTRARVGEDDGIILDLSSEVPDDRIITYENIHENIRYIAYCSTYNTHFMRIVDGQNLLWEEEPNVTSTCVFVYFTGDRTFININIESNGKSDLLFFEKKDLRYNNFGYVNRKPKSYAEQINDASGAKSAIPESNVQYKRIETSEVRSYDKEKPKEPCMQNRREWSVTEGDDDTENVTHGKDLQDVLRGTQGAKTTGAERVTEERLFILTIPDPIDASKVTVYQTEGNNVVNKIFTPTMGNVIEMVYYKTLKIWEKNVNEECVIVEYFTNGEMTLVELSVDQSGWKDHIYIEINCGMKSYISKYEFDAKTKHLKAPEERGYVDKFWGMVRSKRR